MTTIATEAWVLHRAPERNGKSAELCLEPITLPGPGPRDLLVEPLYGSWEGNMGHALARKPIDIAAFRGEDRVVLGNSGVVRVLACGDEVRDLREGDVCLLLGGVWDENNYIDRAFAYDAKNTTGVLAKRTIVPRNQLAPVPRDTAYSLAQWAAFSLRYITAWGNWSVASACYDALHPRTNGYMPHVFAWGGGTAFAEVTLARLHGYQTAMISSNATRLKQIADAGVVPIDRRTFSRLAFDEEKFARDPAALDAYRDAERAFLATVDEVTSGRRVSIFIDQIGSAVTPATLKALAKPGVIASSGWKTGMDIKSKRAVSAMNWHSHVNTHYARYEHCAPAIEFGERHGWMPQIDEPIVEFEDVPRLAQRYANGDVVTYFPMFRVNPE